MQTFFQIQVLSSYGKRLGAHFAAALKDELGRKKLSLTTLESVCGKMLDLVWIHTQI